MDSKTRAKLKYAKKSILRRSIDFNKNTEKEIIEHLEKQNSFSRYIKDLILEDMKKEVKENGNKES